MNTRQMQAVVSLSALVAVTVAVQHLAIGEGAALGLSSQQTLWVLGAGALVATALLVRKA